MRKLPKTKANYEKTAIELWKMCVAMFWGQICECCGNPAEVCHHYIEKSENIGLKFVVENGVPLCLKCHYLIHFGHNADKIREMTETIRQGRGKEWCKWIDTTKRIFGQSFKTIGYLKGIIAELKSYLENKSPLP